MNQKTLGEFLRRGREQKQLSLSEVARRTRVSLTSLQALEENRWEELPHELFVRGFLKSYAHLVGLVPEEVFALYKPPVGKKAVVLIPRRGSVFLTQSRLFGVTIACVLLLCLALLALFIVWKPRAQRRNPLAWNTPLTSSSWEGIPSTDH